MVTKSVCNAISQALVTMLDRTVIDTKIEKVKTLYESVKDRIPHGALRLIYAHRHYIYSLHSIEESFGIARTQLRNDTYIVRRSYVSYLNALYEALKKYA